MTHLQRWVGTMLDNLDNNVDKNTRIKILENCGRSCIPSSFIKKARAYKVKSANNDEFLDRLGKIWKHLQYNGKKVYVNYDKCYCPMMKSYKGKLSKSFCNCSRGWIKELFESALDKPVEVALLKSIMQGDKSCRFEVKI